MRRLLLLAAAALFLGPAMAHAQALTYSSGQTGTVGTETSATDPNGNALRAVLPAAVPLRGTTASLDISATTLVATGAHRVATLCVITAGSAAGSLNDSATTGAATTTNEVYAIPNAVGCVELDWPISAGIVVTPGTGQAVSIAYQ